MKQYRGKNYGVFAGTNGYYVDKMESHYHDINQGNGWTDAVLEKCNREAKMKEKGKIL